jgi:hypothetical protein
LSAPASYNVLLSSSSFPRNHAFHPVSPPVVPDTHRVLSPALAGGGLLDLGPYVILPVLLALYHHPSNEHASPTNLTGRMMLRNGVDLSTSVTMDFDKLQAKAFREWRKTKSSAARDRR